MTGIDPHDDRVLVAYVDGELGVMDALAVETALERDAVLRGKVADLRASADLLRAAYGSVARQALPTAVLALIDAAPVVAPSPAVNDNVKPEGGWAARRYQVFGRIAAALVLVLAGAAGGWLAAGRGGVDKAAAARMDVVAEAAAAMLVQRALENIVSGASDVWRDPRSGATVAVTPVRTFKDGDDRYCREYRETLTRGGEHILLRLGVACRDAGGRWNSRFHIVPGADPPEGLAH